MAVQPVASRFYFPEGSAEHIWLDPAPTSTSSPSWFESIHRDDRSRFNEALGRCRATGSAQVSYRILTADGPAIWIGERITSAGDDQVEGIAWTTPLDLAVHSRTLADLMPALIYLYDYPADQLLEVNQYGSRLAGATLEELGGSAWAALLHEHDATELPRHRRRLRRIADGESLATSFRLRSQSGAHWQLTGRETIVAREPGGQPWLVLGFAQDASDAMKLERDLLRSVLHDAATQLPNRMLFHERLEVAVRNQARHGFPIALLMIGLERFGMVNEGLGRTVGDQVLARIARRIEECLNDEDTVSRFSGEEFAILVEGVRREEALALATRILAALISPFDLSGPTIHVSARIGISVGQPGASVASTLLHESEVALSVARQGANPVQVYDNHMASQAAAQLHLDAELRRALDRGELTLLYQPICSLSTGAVRSFEGLIRWNHPTRGLLAPGQFLDNAGVTGLIVPIGYLAVEIACKQLAAWAHLPGEFSISVNVDGQQFSQPDIALRVAAILSRYKVDPKRLKLEVTETVIMQAATDAAAQLNALRALGVGVLLDDFGTGFSSLARLRDLPIDTLKIDRVFTQRATTDNESDEIIRAIITMARNLGIETVAEGIESHSQAEMMAREGCDSGQGFYFHAPLIASEAARLIQRD